MMEHNALSRLDLDDHNEHDHDQALSSGLLQFLLGPPGLTADHHQDRHLLVDRPPTTFDGLPHLASSGSNGKLAACLVSSCGQIYGKTFSGAASGSAPTATSSKPAEAMACKRVLGLVIGAGKTGRCRRVPSAQVLVVICLV